MDPIILLLHRGAWFGWVFVLAGGALWAWLGPWVVRRFREARAVRRREALGNAVKLSEIGVGQRAVTVRGRLRVRGQPVGRHHDAANVAASSAESGTWSSHAQATELELECDDGIVRFV